jgi:3-oxoacyl-[acyl-carrier protein] reductase
VEHGFSGRTALVTGAGRNLGRAIALAFADAGANVVVNVRSNAEEGEQVAKEVRARGVDALVVAADVGDPDADEMMVAQAVERFGCVDYLVNNAAPRPGLNELHEHSVADWDGVVAATMSAIFYLGRLILPAMVERRFGRVINVSGADASFGHPGRPAHIAAKSGMHGLTKWIASKYGEHGITANVVVVGPMDTTKTEDQLRGGEVPYRAEARWVDHNLAIPRMGRPEAIGDACVFFASERAGYLTAQMLYVTGGLRGGLWPLP